MPSSACAVPPSQPPSFPTRRSSDLRFVTERECPDLVGRFPVGAELLLEQLGVVREYAARGLENLARAAAVLVQDDGSLDAVVAGEPRSEEHTSELQSLRHLVCRLLLAPYPRPSHPLSLHDALPISASSRNANAPTS